MQLYLNDTSPFARLVLVTALEAGIENVQLRWVDPWESPDALTEINPFSTVPTLKPDTELALFESLLICQYLFGLCRKNATVKLWDADDLHRLAAGKTLMEVSFRSVVLQRFVAQPESCEWYVRGRASIGRALACIDNVFYAPPENGASDFSMADLCLALALSYMRFRLPELIKKKATGETLSKLERWEKRRSFELTSPQALKAKPETLVALRVGGASRALSV
ncbi:MAG: glutathione S-transferase family protein [Burkholderiales bacterium]|jgi:glutathione S-transferase|nr:glutathione S-transferase family protein [Burkholderiales bacterium]